MTRSTRQKGTAFQAWCTKWLREHGYDVHNQAVAARAVQDKITGKLRWFSYRNDIFGCDLIAMKSPDELRFIQCTEHPAVGKRFAEFASYDWPLKKCSVELWQKIKLRRVVVIRRFTGDELVLWGEIERGKLKLYA